MYEPRHQPLLSRRAFVTRMIRHAGLALAILLVSLAIGILGYRVFEGRGWYDSLLSASMILSGMGPVGEITHNSAKVFASIYALFSGFGLLATFGVLLAPIVHRFLHHFHLKSRERE